MKRRTNELGAIAGFEKSGHYFLREPYGLGYDCGLASAIAVLRMLDRQPDKSMADLYRDLPQTWGSPTMSPHCADEVKYGIVEQAVKHFQKMQPTAASWPASRSANWSRSTASASFCRTAPGGWCAHRPTSRNWWSCAKARHRKR
jgi:phosphomannomutase/phosphoglucomutase